MISHPDSQKDVQKNAAPQHAGENARQLFKIVDNRGEAIQQRRMIHQIANSPLMVAQQKTIQRIFGAVAQKEGLEEEELQRKTANIHQLMGGLEEEEMLQGKFDQALPVQKKENNTGLPDSLKSGVENLSGMSLDHVKVHYGSDKPAQLNALAYAQGSDIHVASGQEKHLPHEAWHVVQQMQGRVQPTMDVQGVSVNDDVSLETEADQMGAKASSK